MRDPYVQYTVRSVRAVHRTFRTYCTAPRVCRARASAARSVRNVRRRVPGTRRAHAKHVGMRERIATFMWTKLWFAATLANIVCQCGRIAKLSLGKKSHLVFELVLATQTLWSFFENDKQLRSDHRISIRPEWANRDRSFERDLARMVVRFHHWSCS